MIVIVDTTHDVHVQVVKHHLERRGAAVFVCDPQELGAGAALTFWSDAPERSEWRRRDGTTLCTADARAVWFRPKQPPTIPLEVGAADDRRFVLKEWDELRRGVFALLDDRMVNPLRATLLAAKPLQLAIARRVGLNVPETVITNSADHARAFVERAAAVVHKPLTSAHARMLPTTPWREEDAAALPELELAPTIFQRRVTGTRELRVTVVGEQVFAAELGSDLVDARLDLAAKYLPHTLPIAITRGLLALTEQLSLPYAAVDLRIGLDGEYVFLEANPAGQFLWVEMRTEQPISAAMADLLLATAERT